MRRISDKDEGGNRKPATPPYRTRTFATLQDNNAAVPICTLQQGVCGEIESLPSLLIDFPRLSPRRRPLATSRSSGAGCCPPGPPSTRACWRTPCPSRPPTRPSCTTPSWSCWRAARSAYCREGGRGASRSAPRPGSPGAEKSPFFFNVKRLGNAGRFQSWIRENDHRVPVGHLRHGGRGRRLPRRGRRRELQEHLQVRKKKS